MLALDAANDGSRTQKVTGKDGKILVVVQLAGGNDGLSTIVPYADDVYQRARGAAAHAAKEVLKINDHLGLHASLAPLKAMYDDGHLGIVQGVGYPNPNRSHFRATDIWASAQPDKEAVTSGWVGRYFDNACPGCDPHVGMAIGASLPLAMQGEKSRPLSIERPEAYRYQGRDRHAYEALNHATAGSATTRPGLLLPNLMAETTKYRRKVEVTPAAQLDFLERTALDAQVSSDEILRLAGNHRPTTTYPQGDFGQGLQTIAAMIAGRLPDAGLLRQHGRVRHPRPAEAAARQADGRARPGPGRVLGRPEAVGQPGPRAGDDVQRVRPPRRRQRQRRDRPRRRRPDVPHGPQDHAGAARQAPRR